MNKNALITVIVIIIVIIGVIAVISYSNSQPSAPSTDQEQTANTSPSADAAAAVNATGTSSAAVPPAPLTVDVSYGDAGFLPASVTVKAGDTVRFTNNSSGRMWVASDPHPVHTDLPAFDEKASVDPGGNWSYTFTEVGTHPYHNHAKAANRGTVIVQ